MPADIAKGLARRRSEAQFVLTLVRVFLQHLSKKARNYCVFWHSASGSLRVEAVLWGLI